MDSSSNWVQLTRYESHEPFRPVVSKGAASLRWRERVNRSAELINAARDAMMEEANLIGHVSRVTREAKWHMRLKSVQFSWQRGVKIGKSPFIVRINR